VLSDFGIAVVQRTLGSLSMQKPAGTPIYMAPEQIRHKPCAASDQYALGVMVYEWLCGEPPFHGLLYEILSQHLHKPPPSLHARLSLLPPVVEACVFRALAKDPEQRFSSVTDFASVLSEAFFATQSSSLYEPAEHRLQDQTIPPLSAPVSSLSEQDHPDYATQPHLKTAQRIERQTDQDKKSIQSETAENEIIFQHSQKPPSMRVLNPPIEARNTALPKLLRQRRSRRMVLYAGIVLAGGGITWFAFSKGLPAPVSTPPAPTPTPSAALTHPDRAIQKWTFPTDGSVVSSPTVVNGVVYVGSYDMNVYALDATAGKKIWAFPTRGTVHISPTVVDGVLYVGSYDKNAYALDAATGKKIWDSPIGGSVTSSWSEVINGVFYVGSSDGKVYALNTSTGKPIWTFPTGGKVWSSPMVVNGMLYVGSDDGKAYALDAGTGKPIWAFLTRDRVPSSPTVVDGVLYVGSYDKNVYALDATTGEKIRAFPTGGSVWSSPRVANGVLYVGTYDHKVYALDITTGKQKWTFPTGDDMQSSPTVVNGVVYIGSYDKKVYALDATTGKQIWAFPTGGKVWSSPTVVNGMLYTGSGDKKVYALTLPVSSS
jgi:outer membrane protein assembly factor BamB